MLKRHTHKQAFNQLLYWAHSLIPLPSYSTCNYLLQRTQRKKCCLPPVHLHRAVLHMCVAAAFIFDPYWPHPHLIDISFSPISFSLADRMPLMDVSLHPSLTFVRCMLPTWVPQPWDVLNAPPPSPPLTAEASHTNMQRHSEAHTQAETHRSAFFFSTCDLG